MIGQHCCWVLLVRSEARGPAHIPGGDCIPWRGDHRELVPLLPQSPGYLGYAHVGPCGLDGRLPLLSLPMSLPLRVWASGVGMLWLIPRLKERYILNNLTLKCHLKANTLIWSSTKEKMLYFSAERTTLCGGLTKKRWYSSPTWCILMRYKCNLDYVVLYLYPQLNF